MVSCAYLRFSISLPAILIPACDSSSLAFLVMCSAYKLNKQGDSRQPWCAPVPVLNQSVAPRPVLSQGYHWERVRAQGNQFWYQFLPMLSAHSPKQGPSSHIPEIHGMMSSVFNHFSVFCMEIHPPDACLLRQRKQSRIPHPVQKSTPWTEIPPQTLRMDVRIC